MPHHATIDSPVGHLALHADDTALLGLCFTSAPLTESPRDAVLQQTVAELAEYFAGQRNVFTVPFRPEGTDFQRRVWALLLEIPHGHTWTYAQLAQRLGNPSAVRAVGAANGQNPISILVPCHRVVGANGRLIGYGGGLENKAWLLAHEGAGQLL